MDGLEGFGGVKSHFRTEIFLCENKGKRGSKHLQHLQGGAGMRLLTSENVAELLLVSKATLSRMCRSGDIPHIVLRAGKRKRVIRFRESDMERWLMSRTCTGSPSRAVKRKSGRIGNGVATEKGAVLEVSETKSENGQGH